MQEKETPIYILCDIVLSEKTQCLLAKAVLDMLDEQAGFKMIDGHGYCGFIATDFAFAVHNNFIGIEFFVTLEMECGIDGVTCIVHDPDLVKAHHEKHRARALLN